MKRRQLICLAIFLVSGLAIAQERSCIPSSHAKVSGMAGLEYPKARKALLAAGWQPLLTHRVNEADETLMGQERDVWKQRYYEIVSCTVNGFCNFLFNDVYNNRLRVVTSGEDIKSAVVINFRFVCNP